jgi:biotin transporter BioY
MKKIDILFLVSFCIHCRTIVRLGIHSNSLPLVPISMQSFGRFVSGLYFWPRNRLFPSGLFDNRLD